MAEHIESSFSSDYFDAREKFLGLAKSRQAALTSYVCGASGKNEKSLSCDVALLGKPDARQMLVVISGTHGVEGFYGSGVQNWCMRTGYAESLPEDTALLLVHAINPYGFAHLRRTNEDNIDLNRNFSSGEHSNNSAYASIHPMLVPQNMDGPARAAADREIEQYIEAEGMAAYLSALSSGQNIYPNGLFFSGNEPCWSHTAWLEIVDTFIAGRERVILLDCHTGLGPRGQMELIHVGDNIDTARRIWGEKAHSLSDGSSRASQAISGSLLGAAAARLQDMEVICAAMEVGTEPAAFVIDALRLDAWLTGLGNASPEQVEYVKTLNRHAFYEDTPDWRAAALGHAETVLGEASAFLNLKA